MPVYRGTTPLKAYRGDMQPVNVYKGSTKVAGWHASTASGPSPLTVDCDYNVPPDALTIDGKCSQVVSCWGTNMLAHSSFDATTGWTPSGSTLSVSANKLDVLTTTAAGNHYAQQQFIPTPIAGHKYYGAAYCEAISGQVVINVWNRKTDGSFEGASSSKVTTGGWVSAILSVTSLYSIPTLHLRLSLLNSSGSDTFTGTNQESKFSYACLIDLTAAFGAGKEPSAATMDTLMSAFPNSWFDGSAMLSTDTTTYTANSPSPTYPAPISTITGNVGIMGTNGADSNTVTAALGSNVCADLKDGTKDVHDPATGVLTKRVGKVVFDGSVDEGWGLVSTLTNTARFVITNPLFEIGGTGISDRFAYDGGSEDVEHFRPTATGGTTHQIYIWVNKSRLATVDIAGFKAWLAANPVTVYYKLATPTTVQLTPHLPVVRTGIKTLSIGADVAPNLTATVKAMD